jgi:AraC-like DNA-binding protein
LGVEDYASLMGISAVRLTRACRTATQSSPLELIHERVMREACRELSYSDRSVSQIAYGLGFEEPSYFSRRFREVVGVAPIIFRQNKAEHRPEG